MRVKRIVSIILAVILLCASLTSCSMFQKSDEALIAERVAAFLTAYNNGDMEGVLACMDTKTRNRTKASMNLAGGIFGGLTGFNFNVSDLFALEMGIWEDGVLFLNITDINISDKENAVVTTEVNLEKTMECLEDMFGQWIDESSTEMLKEYTIEIYFAMVYEKDGWYISDMSDATIKSADGSVITVE